MLTVTDLRVEDLTDPLGLDVARPRFIWGFEATAARSVRQTAYRVAVASTDERLAQGEADIWDSGRVESRQNAGVAYGGPPLASATSYAWRVWVWPSGDAHPDSAGARWETGLFHPRDWRAAWIGVGPDELRWWAPTDGYERAISLPLIRRDFTLHRPIRRARAYICGLGQFELRLNGVKCGDRLLEPGWTNYDKTCLYAVHDVSRLVRTGANAIGVMLGNGFYNVVREPGRYMKIGAERNAPERTVGQGDPVVIAQLLLEYEDGATEWIGSDATWSVNSGPIVYSDVYGGEDYDARREHPGWDAPGFDEDGRWSAVSVVPGPGGRLRAEVTPPNRVMGIVRPVHWGEPEPGVFVADLGENIAGWMRLTMDGGAAGDRITLTPGELLDERGLVRQELEQRPGERMCFRYIKKGDREESWAPRFSYTGFRYVQVDGAQPRDMASSGYLPTDRPALTSLAGELIHPDLPAAGEFACSAPLWDSIHALIRRAILCNTKSVLTDCPHREKLGWLEEVHLMAPSILYNVEAAPLFRKIAGDIADSQRDDGLVPSIAPEYAVFQGGFRDSPEWGGASVIVPWYLYNWQGDQRILEQHYDVMARYVAYLSARAADGLVGHGLGDWADVGPHPPFAQNTPVPLTATSMYHYLLRIMRETALLLGRDHAARIYEELADRARVAFRDAFVDPATGQIGTGSQTSNGMSLALGLVDRASAPAILDHLCADIRGRGYHTTSGDVGHRFVLMALADNDRSDVIASMLRQTDYPSYGYQVAHGATTLTEFWDGPTRGLSQNHFMLGHVEEWFYRHLAGIARDYDGRDTNGTTVTIQPYIAPGVAWVHARHRLPQGDVRVRWRSDGSRAVRVEVDLPANSEARVRIPTSDPTSVRESGGPVDGADGVAVAEPEARHVWLRVGSGRYVFDAAL